VTLRALTSAAGTAVLAIWFVGVTGRLGTSPTANWTLFVVGNLLVFVSGAGAVLPRRQ
jgi:hypothetical protein